MKKLHLFFTLMLVVFCSSIAKADGSLPKPVTVNLWENNAPNDNGDPQDTAFVYIYHAPSDYNTGRAIVICPGGGYTHLSMTNEGTNWAEFYQAQGITAVLLKYRMPHENPDVPISDAEAAIRMVRNNAEVWGVNNNEVGIMGFSAGGHLASTIATKSKGDARPDFQILLYPVISMKDEVTHLGSQHNLLGKEVAENMKEEFCSHLQVTDETPRAFICLANDDRGVIPENGVSYYMALCQHKIPASLHIYPKGGHGFGFRDTFLNHKEMLDELNAWLRGFQSETQAKPDREGYDFVVATDGTGDFTSVQEAINAVPDFRKNVRTRILVRRGYYHEKVVVAPCKLNISLIGEDGAVITYNDYAQKPNRFGEEKGTSGSSTIYIYAPDFYAEGITFQNTAGPVGQAVACFISADRVSFRNCRFLGFQDTLYTYGEDCRLYFEDCYVEGTVDFIFGWSTAIFNRCQMHSLRDGYVTAPSTMQGASHGYVFYDCRLTAEPDVKNVFLSRPWRPYAQAVFIRCDLGRHILPEGWNDWGKEHPEQTVNYVEYQSTGPGANPLARAYFSHQLTDLSKYNMSEILAGVDGWNPQECEPGLVSVKR